MERRDDWIGHSRSSTSSPLSIHPSSILANRLDFPTEDEGRGGLRNCVKTDAAGLSGGGSGRPMRNPFLKCRDDFFGVLGQM
jgi:hypothetical protein